MSQQNVWGLRVSRGRVCWCRATGSANVEVWDLQASSGGVWKCQQAGCIILMNSARVEWLVLCRPVSPYHCQEGGCIVFNDGGLGSANVEAWVCHGQVRREGICRAVGLASVNPGGLHVSNDGAGECRAVGSAIIKTGAISGGAVRMCRAARRFCKCLRGWELQCRSAVYGLVPNGVICRHVSRG